MPYLSKKYCPEPHCGAIIDSDARACVLHRNNPERKRSDYDWLYSTAKWRKIREVQLGKQPLCMHCKEEGKTVAATQVDHIIPITKDFSKRFELANLQSLCHSHHSKKTYKETLGK